ADFRDRLGEDAPVLLVAQALPDELLGHGGRELCDLAPQLVARASDVRLHLRPGALDEPLRLRAGGVDEPRPLLRRLLQRLGADRGRLSVEGPQARLVLLPLARGLGARGLGFLERRAGQEQGDEAHDRARPVASTLRHKEALPGVVMLAKVCENYHAIAPGVNRS